MSDKKILMIGALLFVLVIAIAGIDDLRNLKDVNYIQFNTNYENGCQEGRVQWNMDDGTVEVCMPGGNVRLQVGQEVIVKARNLEGTTINNCQVVYISGATGSVVEVQTPIANNTTEAPRTFAMATEQILNNQQGYFTLIGLVRDCDTSLWSEGDILYLSNTEEGNLTNVRPIAPNITVIIGVVARSHATEGVIAVKPIVQPRLQLLSDVFPTGLSDGDILQYNATSNRFEFEEISYINTWFHNDTDPYTVILGDGNFHAYDNWVNNTSKGITLMNNTTIRLDHPGVYKIDLSVSFSGGGNQEYDGTIFVNGIEQENTHFHRKTGTGGDIGNAGVTGVIVELEQNDLIEIHFRDEDSPHNNINIKGISLVIHKIN